MKTGGRILYGLVILALALALPWLGISTPAQAAGTIQVTSTADDLTINGNCTLREAIQAVNTGSAVDACPAGASGSTIQLGEGTYQLTLSGQAENHNQTGDLDILISVKILGVARDKTILDANHLDRMLDNYAPGASLTLSQLTIQNGSLTDFPENPPEQESYDWFGKGGGVRNFGSLQADHLLVTNNLVDEPIRGTGGGIYNFGTLSMQDSVFDHNESAYTGGGIASSGTLTLTEVYFEYDYGYAAAELEITGQGATALMTGGGFYGSRCTSPSGNMLMVGEGAALTLKGMRITFNQCTTEVIANWGDLRLQDLYLEEGGGQEAVINQHAGSLLILNSIIDTSGAPSDFRSGVVTVTGGQARIDQSTLTKNSGRVVMLTGGALDVINSSLASNNAIGMEIDSGSLTLESVTLANNQSGAAGLVANGGTVRVHNSLIANNHNDAGEGADCQLTPGSTTSAGYNLVSVTDGCGWVKASGDQTGTRKSPIDPLLLPLATDEDGITASMALQPGSPAINSADPTACPPTDQRGVTRPQGPRCDIGAYEAAVGQEVLPEVIYLPMVGK